MLILGIYWQAIPCSQPTNLWRDMAFVTTTGRQAPRRIALATSILISLDGDTRSKGTVMRYIGSKVWLACFRLGAQACPREQ